MLIINTPLKPPHMRRSNAPCVPLVKIPAAKFPRRRRLHRHLLPPQTALLLRLLLPPGAVAEVPTITPHLHPLSTLTPHHLHQHPPAVEVEVEVEEESTITLLPATETTPDHRRRTRLYRIFRSTTTAHRRRDPPVLRHRGPPFFFVQLLSPPLRCSCFDRKCKKQEKKGYSGNNGADLQI